MRALHPRVLFVAGVPRSGTTLVEQFIQMHGGVVALPSDPLTREPLSLSNGGSGRCLADFCNTLGNSRFARNATARAIRLDVAGLLGHADAQHGVSWRERALLVVKDPAYLLVLPELLAASAHAGTSAAALVVARSPLQWESDRYNCTNYCRRLIVRGWAACHAAALDLGPMDLLGPSAPPSARRRFRPGAVAQMRFEDFGEAATWQALERWLGLSVGSVPLKIEGPAGATQQHGRRLHFHRGADDAGAAGSLTVDARLLRPLCQQTISKAFARRFGAVSQMGYR